MVHESESMADASSEPCRDRGVPLLRLKRSMEGQNGEWLVLAGSDCVLEDSRAGCVNK